MATSTPTVQGNSHDQVVKGKDRTSFAQLNPPLNPLLLSALSTLSLCYPTQVQKDFIPLALNGKDILARSITGSGKTLAYAIPIVQGILESRAKHRSNSISTVLHVLSAIVLVPTRDLSEQVTKAISDLCKGMGNEAAINIVNLAAGDNKRSKRKMAKVEDHQPDVLVSTPARLLDKLRATPIDLSSLSYLVLDEADLILSYGHSFDDIKSILSGSGINDQNPWRFPSFYQSFLMSATMTSEVTELKSLVLRNPEILYVKESINELQNLTQFSIKVNDEQDKFLLIYVIFRLKLIKGKSLVFVNSTDKSYQLKLFLEKFGIRSGVLNAELPFNSRYHAVQEFNKGIFDYLIATDEGETTMVKSSSQAVEATQDLPQEDSTLISTQPRPDVPPSKLSTSQKEPSSSAKQRKRKDRDENFSRSHDKPTDFGVSRGVDFINVACVINFDLPTSAQSYTHRIGRTARAGRTGIALSFVLAEETKPSRESNKTNLVKEVKMWQMIETQQAERGSRPKEYKFDMQQVEGFRYRMQDALRSVTKAAIREARIKEIKNEVLNSEKLKAHFEENPSDLLFLKHDKPLHPTRIQPHMKHVPSYLIPKISNLPIQQQQPQPDPTTELESTTTTTTSNTRENETSKKLLVPFHKTTHHRNNQSSRGRGRGRGSKSSSRGNRKKDPLKSFKTK